MAEEKAAQQAAGGESSSGKGQKPTFYILLAIVNMLVIIGIGTMLWMDKKKQAHEPGIDDVIKGEKMAQEEEVKNKDFIGQLIPLETFLVNLSGSRGRKLLKLNMELEVDNENVLAEIEQLKPKIRDIIIVILSSKTYTQVSTKDGKDILRNEIRDQVNLFITKGQIKRVYFTELIYN
ncbi:MAG: flagellar basal body-associated FliL family protein [Bdellovibrionaceae bacterium]|nr:flagellar basal body-associated FliL family protein [Pseudobdellovibrionaceae bacterium]